MYGFDDFRYAARRTMVLCVDGRDLRVDRIWRFHPEVLGQATRRGTVTGAWRGEGPRLAYARAPASCLVGGGAIPLAVHLKSVPISNTSAWMTIAKWVESVAG